MDATSLGVIDGAPRLAGQVAHDHWRELYDSWDRKDVVGLGTGFRALDGIVTGLQPCDLIVLAARPSIGKTSLALSIARRTAEKGLPVMLFSLEMSAEQVAERLIAAGAEINMREVRARRLRDDKWEAGFNLALHLGSTPFHIDDSRSQTTHSILAKARRVKAVGLVVIDYLGLIQDPHDPRVTRAEQVGRQVKRLRALAGELRCPVLLLCQLNRQPEARADKKPELPLVMVRWDDASRADGCELPDRLEDALVPQLSFGALLKGTRRCLVILQNYTLSPGDPKHDYLVIPNDWAQEVREFGRVQIPGGQLTLKGPGLRSSRSSCRGGR